MHLNAMAENDMIIHKAIIALHSTTIYAYDPQRFIRVAHSKYKNGVWE
jgi:hypothetical protein